MELLICRNTYDLEFAQHGKNKSNCTHYKNGNCGLDGQLCHVDTYVKKEPSHVSIVMSALLDAEIEYINSDDFFSIQDRKTVAEMTVARIRDRTISYQEIK